MKYFKKMVTCLVALCMLTLPVIANANGMEGTRIETVNVAKGKNVYAAATTEGGRLTNGVLAERLDPSFCTYPTATVTLPTGDVVKGSDSAATDWYIVDLGEAYAIKEIRLYSRGDEPSVNDNWMSKFDLEVSNSILFDDYVRVGGIGDTIEGTGVTSSSTPYVAVLDGETAYRYVRLKKTAWTYYGWGELEVYADVTIVDPYANATFIEISRNKPAEVNYGSYYDGETVGNWSPDKVVDGKFSDAQGWIMDGVSDRPQAPYNLLVDLEKEMPITKIEMFGRPNVGAEAYRKNWKVYGFTEADGKPDISGEISGGVELIDVTSPFPQITDTQNPDADDGLSEIVDDSVPFRYLVFSKTANELGCLSEIRAYTIMPEVLNVEMVNAQKAQISFNTLVESSAVESGIAAEVNGEEVYPTVTFTDDYTAELDFGKEYFDSKIDIHVKAELTNKYGVSFAEKVLQLFTPKAVSAEVSWIGGTDETSAEITSLSEALASGSAAAKVVIKNNTQTDDADVIVLTVLYNDKNFVVASKDVCKTAEKGTEEIIISGFNLPSGVTAENADSYKLSVFVWKDYNIMKPWLAKTTLGE